MATTTVACGSSAPEVGSLESVDSAGVEIVTIALPNLGSRAWRNAVVPELEIGLESGPDAYLLDRVRAAVRLSDGRIVVAAGGSNELRLFDPAGGYLRKVGREGEGPGEFAYIDLLASFAGDSILVFDRSLQRATVFDSSGTFVNSWRVADGGAPVFQSGAGVLRNGDLVTFAAIDTDPEAAGPYTSPMVVGIVSRTDQGFRAIDTIRSWEEARVERDGSLTRAFRPFGRKSDVAVSPDFIFVLDALAERSIHVYSDEGDLVRILRFDIPRVASTSDRVAAWRASFIARYGAGSNAVLEWWNYGFDRTPPPDSIPHFRSLEVDKAGNLCAERYPLTETAPRVYWCFSDRGELLRSITVDAGLSQNLHPHLTPQLEVGPDGVLGVWVDELGVERVRSYRLVRDSAN